MKRESDLCVLSVEGVWVEPGLEAFIGQEQARLLAVLVLRLGDRAEAEDVAQEALLRLVRRWDQVRGYDSPAGWLHRIAMNLAASRWRRARSAVRMRSRIGTSVVHVDADGAEIQALRTELSALPGRQRDALLLRHVAGLSPAEVAGVMDASPQAIRNLTHRAAATLRHRLTDEEP